MALGKEFRDRQRCRRQSSWRSVIHGIPIDDAEMLIRAFTNYFQLVNLCEDNERIRRIQAA